MIIFTQNFVFIFEAKLRENNRHLPREKNLQFHKENVANIHQKILNADMVCVVDDIFNLF